MSSELRNQLHDILNMTNNIEGKSLTANPFFTWTASYVTFKRSFAQIATYLPDV